MGQVSSWVAALKHTLGATELALLAQIVDKRAPELASAIPRFPSALSDSERQGFEDCLAEELLSTGFESSDEPNERGLGIEHLIGVLFGPEAFPRATDRPECEV